MFFRSSSPDSTPPQIRYSYTSSAFWFKEAKLHAVTQLLDSKEVSKPPQSSYFYHFDCVQFIIERIKLIVVSCSPYTIIVNRTYIILNFLRSNIQCIIPPFFERSQHSLPYVSIDLVTVLYKIHLL